MDEIYFLNVGNGDTTIIHHGSTNHISMIDINNLEKSKHFFENWNEKNKPIEPITFLNGLKYTTLFRFILTHPDKDHLTGFNDLKNGFSIGNYWFHDVQNNDLKENIDYQAIRSIIASKNHKNYEENDMNKYYNQDDNNGCGDNIYILSPNNALIKKANDEHIINKSSYVLKFKALNKYNCLFCGDADKEVIEHLINNHSEEIKDIDILFAPHHGRKVEKLGDLLNICNPKVTLLGNFPSEFGSYDYYNKKCLPHFTNNQGGSFYISFTDNCFKIYCSNVDFAKKNIPDGDEIKICNETYGLLFKSK